MLLAGEYQFALGRTQALGPGETAFPSAIADELAPGSQIARELPGFHAERVLKRGHEFARASTQPELIGPGRHPFRMLLVPVKEDHAHGIKLPEETAHVRGLFVPVSQHE